MLHVVSLSLSLFFQTCIHFHLFIYLKRRPPTQCCDTAFLGIGWQCGSRGISLFFFLALSPFFPTRCLLVTRIHTLPASSIITPPSIQDTAESWCCQPEPDALSHSNMRHLSGLAPPPCCSLSSRYTSVARVTGFGPFWKVGGGMCYFKPKNLFFVSVFLLERITGHARGNHTHYHTDVFWLEPHQCLIFKFDSKVTFLFFY